jgi:hypothetical protein
VVEADGAFVIECRRETARWSCATWCAADPEHTSRRRACCRWPERRRPARRAIVVARRHDRGQVLTTAQPFRHPSRPHQDREPSRVPTPT